MKNQELYQIMADHMEKNKNMLHFTKLCTLSVSVCCITEETSSSSLNMITIPHNLLRIHPGLPAVNDQIKRYTFSLFCLCWMHIYSLKFICVHIL